MLTEETAVMITRSKTWVRVGRLSADCRFLKSHVGAIINIQKAFEKDNF